MGAVIGLRNVPSPDHRRIIEAYAESGRIISIRRRRDGSIVVSLNGGRSIPLREAIDRIGSNHHQATV